MENMEVLKNRITYGDVRAVSKLITMLEAQDPFGNAVVKSLDSLPSQASIIGITGYPGAGKSTLIDQLTTCYRAEGKKVGILAVDTSSPRTGGAILGDRIRMQSHWSDEHVYIRSMATRGHHGGLAKATGDAIQVLEAAGYDVILVETVGVGQEEGQIIDLAQTVVVVVAPGLGDDIQAMKAGLLEIAHLVVVNKADRSDADATVHALRNWVSHVIPTIALNGEGIHAVIDAIDAHQRKIVEQHTYRS
ncbi:MAG: LAO/AO transport system kinase [Nitrospirales bacterium]|nr:MAG: LAO/AO transport system kinase [Nitrospirales bacterium]